MDHKSSQARTERAWRLRVRGRSWPEVAEAEGFRTARSARAAVRKWLERNPPEDIAILRRAAGDTIAIVIDRLLDSLEAAQAKGDLRGAAQIGQVVLDGVDKRARLEGLHIAVPTEVHVSVQSMTEVLADTRSRLQAAIDAAPAEPLDVDVVQLGELAQ